MLEESCRQCWVRVRDNIGENLGQSWGKVSDSDGGELETVLGREIIWDNFAECVTVC